MAGNNNNISTSTDNSVTYDNISVNVSINQRVGQADPTNVLPLEFDIVFSEPIKPASFTIADITNSGTALVVTWTLTNIGDDTNYILRATVVSTEGSVIPDIAASRVKDLADNDNTLSSYTDNSVTYDLTGPAAPTLAGVTGTGDSVQNNLLSSGAGNDIVTVNWNNIAGESSYKLSVYENDGTTIKCSEVTKAADSTSHTFTGCNLTQGKAYKIKLSSLDSIENATNATNNMYSFLYAPDISIADVTQDENHASGKIVFTLSLNVASDWASSVNYASANNTALVVGMFNDYVATSGTLNISAGNTSGNIEVSLIDGAYDEPDTQDFYLNLSSPVSANLLDAQAVGTINDNDDPPTISIANSEAFELGPNLVFTATLSLASEKTIQYSWATTNGTGSSGTDFTGGTGGPISITSGSTSSTINIPTIDNTTACQIDRDFSIALNTLSNVTAGAQTTATGLVKEDDFPRVLLSDAIVTEGSKALVKAELSTVCPSKDINVTWTVASGSAIVGADLVNQSASFIIRKNELGANIMISTVNDSESEKEEEFFVNASGMVSSINLLGSAAKVVIQDNDGGGDSLKVTKLALGPYNGCALFNDGRFKCWGSRVDGQLADGYQIVGDEASELGDNLYYTEIGTGRSVVSSAIDGSLSTMGLRCVVLDNGQLKCWGQGSIAYDFRSNTLYGGNKAREMGDNIKEFPLASNDPAVEIQAGYNYFCSLHASNQIKCYGDHTTGNLGSGNMLYDSGSLLLQGDSMPYVNFGSGRSVKKYAVSSASTCAILDNDRVKCFGDNTYGQLAIGNTNKIGDEISEIGDLMPYAELGDDAGTPHTVKEIAAGYYHFCAIVNVGGLDKLKCWGRSNSYQTGQANAATIGDSGTSIGNNMLPVDLGSFTPKKVFAGSYSTCVIMTDNTTKCFGANPNAQFALGRTDIIGDVVGELGDSMPSLNPGAGRFITQIKMYFGHACYLLDNNIAKCAGDNSSGQLGHGSLTSYGGGVGETLDLAPNFNPGTGRSVVKLENGGDHSINGTHRTLSSCFILDNGKIKCVGSTTRGDLVYESNFGDDPNEMGTNLPFMNIGTGVKVKDLVIAISTICAHTTDDRVKCWGDGADGRLFSGSTSDFGTNITNTNDNIPYLNFSGRKVKKLWGQRYNFCALLDDNQTACWGTENYGNLLQGSDLAGSAYGDAAGEVASPVYLKLGSSLYPQQVQTGYYSNCALLSNNQVKCWGRNAYGSLGYGDTTDRGASAATIADNLLPLEFGTDNSAKLYAKNISIMNSHACAILNNNKVKCWGSNYNGQLGLGHTNPMGDGPNEMGDNLAYVDLGTGLVPSKIVTAGHFESGESSVPGVSCVLFTNGKVKCWGGGASLAPTAATMALYGNSPNEMGDKLPFVKLGTNVLVKDIYSSTSNICVITTADKVKCWGRNDTGALGYGTTRTIGSSALDLGVNLSDVDLGIDTPVIGNFAISGITGGTDNDADGILANNEASVQWSAASSAAQYKITIYESDKTTVKCSEGTTAASVYSFTGCSLNNNSVYYVKLVAEDGIGNSREANNSMFAFVVDTLAPEVFNILGVNYGADTLIDADLNDGLHVNLHWTKSESAFLYEVQIFENDESTIKCPLVQVDASQLQYTFSNCDLVDATTYKAQVIAKDAANNQIAASNSMFAFTVNETFSPSIFNILGVTGGSDNTMDASLSNGTWAKVHWEDADSENYYIVGIYENDGVTIKCAEQSLAKDTTSFVFDNCSLTDLTTYKIRLRAIDTFVTQAASNNFYNFTVNQTGSSGSFLISGIRSADTVDVVDDNVLSSGNIVRAVWATSAGASSYDVSIWTEDLSSNICGTKNTTANTYDFSSCFLSGGRNYKLKVVAKNAAFTTEAHNSPYAFSLGDYPFITIANANANEGSNIVFTVSLSKTWTSDVTAKYKITTLEAIDLIDFERLMGTVTISAGNLSTTISVPTVDDLIPEATERFIISLHEVQNAKISKASIAIGSINPSDGITGIQKIETGLYSTCKLDLNGEVKCWGFQGLGRLGRPDKSIGDEPGEMGDNLEYVLLPTGRTALQIANARGASCAVLDNQKVTCWGANEDYRLGNTINGWLGKSIAELGNNMQEFDFGENINQIVGGHSNFCVVTASGKLQCWGDGANGITGRASTADAQMSTLAANFINLGTGLTAKSVSVGYAHACAILNNDRVKCWGISNNGRLGNELSSGIIGDGAGEMGDSLPYVDLGSGLTAKQVVAAYDFTCAILNNDRVKCWGSGTDGGLGQESSADIGDAVGEMGDALVYTNLGTGKTAKKLSALVENICAILDNNLVKCWGDSSFGGLGNTNTNFRGNQANEMGDYLPYVDLGFTAGSPVQVKDISVGWNAACAQLVDDRLKCWGYGDDGIHGMGTYLQIPLSSSQMGENLLPIDFGTGLSLKKMSSGFAYHQCVILNNDKVKCWGADDNNSVVYQGALGTGRSNIGANPGELTTHLKKIDFGSGLYAIDLFAANYGYCALLNDYSLKCWGGTSSSYAFGPHNGTSIGRSVGSYGDNLLPAPFPERDAKIIKISGGSTNMCVLYDNFQVRCAGTTNTLGTDGDGRPSSSQDFWSNSLPINFGVDRYAINISASNNTACALLDNFKIKCWGSNSNFVLGPNYSSTQGDNTGEMGDNLTYIPFPETESFVEVELNSSSACVIRAKTPYSGFCWGANTDGQTGIAVSSGYLGDLASEINSNELGLGGATEILAFRSSALSTNHCAIMSTSRANPQVKCWGIGSNGRLGYESASSRSTISTAINLGTNLLITDLSRSNGHTCASMINSSTNAIKYKCWGYNAHGQLGIGDTNDRGDNSSEMGDNLPDLSF